MARETQHFLPGTLVLLLGVLMMGGVASHLVQAAVKQAPAENALGNGWQTEGMHGAFEVSGDLTESPCHLLMQSEEQTVNLGTIPRYRLTHIGDRSPEVAVHLQLRDCGMASAPLHDDAHEGTVYEFPDQLISLITIVGEESPDSLHLLQVQGEAKGVALRLEDSQHRQLIPGEHSRGLVMQQGNTDLVMYAMLERTELPLKEGPFTVLMNFTLGYH